MDRHSTRDRLLAATLVAGIASTAPGAAWSQAAGRQTGDTTCTGPLVGTVGIGNLDCRGRCALVVRNPGRGIRQLTPAWYFTVEPQITGIAPNSPAAGVLQVGDRLVAVDGVLITTTAGAQRFSWLKPDSSYTIRYRRAGRTSEATLRAMGRCGPALEGGRGFPDIGVDSVTGEVMWRASEGVVLLMRPEPGGRLREGLSIRERVLSEPRVGGRLVPEVPMARYGLNFTCRPSCTGMRRDGERVWRFSGPVAIAGIAEDGPAAAAGLQVGDSITHVDGVRIDTRRGGEAFSTARPGRPVRFTVKGRDGGERTVTITPAERI